MLGDRDFFGDGFDAVRGRAASTSSELRGGSVDEEGATPHAVGLAPLQCTLEARWGALA